MTKTNSRRLRLAWIAAAALIAAIAIALVLLDPLGDAPPTETAPERGASLTPRGEAAPRAAIHLDPDRADALGVRVVPATRSALATDLRAVVTIVPDEARVSHVHTRVSGWIEELHVRTTGEPVERGRELATLFSQELLASQSELLAARRAWPAGAPSPILEGARRRLRVLGMSAAEIAELERRGEPRREVSIVAPRAGVVLHRGISLGTSVDPSTELFTIADLSRVWALGEIPETSAAGVRAQTRARIEIPSSGLPPIDAEVDFVYPTLTERTRSVRVRFVLENPTGALRPGMFGTAALSLSSHDALTVPRDAIVDTGIRQHVFVAQSGGELVPRTVRLGAQTEERVEILEGLAEGERVVAAAVFLIDSESRLRASGGGTGHAHGTEGGAAPAAGHEGHSPTSSAPRTTHEGHGAAP